MYQQGSRLCQASGRTNNLVASELNSPVLPWEIFDLVIANVAGASSPDDNSDETGNLLACCLVCKSFVRLCRQYLFFKVCIRLSARDISGPPKRLVQLMEKDRSISRFIRELCYSFKEIGKAEETPSPMEALLDLPRLRSLTLEEDRDIHNPEYFSYKMVTPTLFACRLLDNYLSAGTLVSLSVRGIAELPVLDILSSPNLTHLDVESCHFDEDDCLALLRNHAVHVFNLRTLKGRPFPYVLLALLFACCPQLETIDLDWVDWDDLDFKPVVLTQSLSTIITQCYIRWDVFCTAAKEQNAYAFPGVKRLEVRQVPFHTTTEVRSGLNILFEHLPGLEHLYLSGMLNYPRVSPQTSMLNDGSVGLVHSLSTIAFSRCIINTASSLKTLKIRWSDERNVEISSIINKLCVALSAVRGCNVLEDLDLHLSIQEGIPTTAWSNFSFATWSRLDEVLLDDNLLNFPFLSGVSIAIDWSGEQAGEGVYEDPVMAEALKVPLKRLFSSVDIAFNCRVMLPTSSR
ncbi:hypothetical protein CVT24_011061 [Panaeolus cyanescens]|uniref:F-box domain-containing protein n=1 Tax=Panaeolus cyanescens TaxID=181874 RepID=A0A409VG00_9AGAR|nr:hypothetical protein CVT24_011061 [Panaeolus cyanescens]